MKNYELSKVEVSGTAMNSFFLALGSHKTLGQKILNESLFGSQLEDGNYSFEEGKWYPIEKGLLLYSKVMEQVGPRTLKIIGSKITESAVFPPQIQDIHSALQSINIAYHMNHRKNGIVMFDPLTGRKLDGIGEYKAESIPGEKKIIFYSENPYPSEMDEGLILGMAKRFESTANIVLVSENTSRRNGGESCEFHVTW
jgi:hypothetical protein